MSVAELETSLCLHVEQIIGGEAKCIYCAAAALFTVSNGADTDPEPNCGRHAASWLDVMADLARREFEALA